MFRVVKWNIENIARNKYTLTEDTWKTMLRKLLKENNEEPNELLHVILFFGLNNMHVSIRYDIFSHAE